MPAGPFGDFSPFDDGNAEPLDVSNLAPQPQSAQQPSTRKKLLHLIPLVAAAVKGGPGALEGLLAGYQQHAQLSEQQATRQAAQDRQMRMDQATLGQQAFQQRHQTQQLEQTRARDHAGLLKQFHDALNAETLTDPDSVKVLTDIYEAQGRALGMPPGSFQSAAAPFVAPSRLEKKAATTAVNRLRTQFGTNWMEEGAKFTHELSGGKRVSFQELLSMAGMQADPNAPPSVTTEIPNTDYARFLDRFARERGKTFATLTVADEAEAKKVYGQADDRPITVNTVATENRTNTRIDRIVSAFNAHPIVKEYNETQAQQGIIQNIVGGQWSGPGDMAAVFAFMKALDPNSVVRETEYANAAKSGNIFQGWAARFNGALNPNGGFLSDRVRRDFLRTINARMDVKTKQYQNLRTQLVGRIDRIKAGAPETGDEALVDYASGGAPIVNEPAAPAAPQGGTVPNPFRR